MNQHLLDIKISIKNQKISSNNPSPHSRHDLSRCPANAADALNDLSTLQPSQSDLNTLLNISDSKNQTNEAESDEFLSTPPRPEFNVQEIDDSTGPDTAKSKDNKKSETSGQENVEKLVERPETPPPIATFEEWTKEKLMNKEKKPMVKEGQQNGASSGQGMPSAENGQNGQASGNGINAGGQEGSGE